MPPASMHNRQPQPDLACSRCRERKIRCDRERPACGNCDREDVECEYQQPGKRINHVKLLCGHVDTLQEKLSYLELNILAMHTTLERVSQSQSQSQSLCQDHRTSTTTGTSPSLPPIAVEASAPSVHLLALCDAFEARLEARMSRPTGDGLCSTTRSQLKDQLQRICAAARGRTYAATPTTEPVPVRATAVSWPTKERTVSAIKHFTQVTTWETSIFEEDHLISACDQAYSHGCPDPTRYAALFNVLVLLALGHEMAKQHHDTPIGDWTLSILPSRIAMLSITDLITTPELVNVQALALLSIVAERFDVPNHVNSIFSQACILALSLPVTSDHFPRTPQDSHEYEMVLQALFVRDKKRFTMQGAVPLISRSVLQEHCKQFEPSHQRQLCLAIIQDQIYHIRHTFRGLESEHIDSAHRIIDDLNIYAQKYGIFETRSENLSISQAALQLEFLSTRILARLYPSSGDLDETLLEDSRASCRILLIANGDISSQIMASHGEYVVNQSKTLCVDESQRAPSSAEIDLGLGSVFDVFSISAWFALLDNAIWGDVKADMVLLRQVSLAYAAHASRMVTGHFHRRVALVLQMTLGVVTDHWQSIRPTSGPSVMSSDPLNSGPWILDSNTLDWTDGSVFEDDLFVQANLDCADVDDNIVVNGRKRPRIDDDLMADIFAIPETLQELGSQAENRD